MCCQFNLHGILLKAIDTVFSSGMQEQVKSVFRSTCRTRVHVLMSVIPRESSIDKPSNIRSVEWLEDHHAFVNN